MRSTTPSPRRLHSRPPRHDLLASVVEIVDDASRDDLGHVLVYLEEPQREVTLGLRPCDIEVHPFDVVAGFTAPREWWAFGIRARGRAHHLDEPGRVTEGIATTFLVDREGHEASLLRAADVVTPLPGTAHGTIPDLCRRVLGVPTAPAPATTDMLWTTRWLDAVLAAWAQPERRRTVMADFSALAALHPAASDDEIADVDELVTIASAHADGWTWSSLRHEQEQIELPDGTLDTDVARWMDDGFFARWTIGAYPSIATLATDLRPLLGEPLGTQLLEAVIALLERVPTPP